ncbi:2-hydroxymuconate tautomerase [Tepidibacillus fermentans]|uniref:Tautomerase n=1 Tax=Tepidibacillus fermentans TaxID=1281767 RepID=A0A4R3KFM9_9BACI|nr:2-hydroxymuconate tautomerase [Tepidibacillus fermentans]TCS82088.1 4-oxalocrotonate tautomerase [Tepidibacillus fermentans]
MPFVTIEMIEGRTPEQKRELVEKITKVVAETVNVPEERVYVFIEDLKKDHFARGGKLIIDQE